jgi:hypothetical protein
MSRTRQGRRVGQSKPPVHLSADLVLWFDPTFGVSLDGSNRGQTWTPRVGSITLAQAVATKRPLMSTYAGHPAWYLDRAREDCFSAASRPAALTGVAPHTVYMCALARNDQLNVQTAWAAGAYPDEAAFGTLNTAEYNCRFSSTGTDPQEFTAPTLNDGSVHAAVYDGANFSSYVNGANTRPLSATTRDVGSAAVLRYGAGINGQEQGYNWGGYLGHMLVYSTAHNAAKISAITAWLRQMSGI